MFFGYSIDVVIFLIYLAINLFVGLRYGKGVNNIQDYALGGRNFSTGALVSTIVATWIDGGGFFIKLSKVYSDGIMYVIASSFMVIPLLIIGYIFSARMEDFLGKLSVAEIMGDLYGNNVRLVTAIAGTFSKIGVVAVQFKAFAYLLNYFFIY